jgi:RIO-like serine/threonine protein kinase
MLLGLFIDLIPILPAGEDAFVLIHPDLDSQNVIVSENGELLGHIDWDGVAAWPKSLGNTRYPSWLTRDWTVSRTRMMRTES